MATIELSVPLICMASVLQVYISVDRRATKQTDTHKKCKVTA